MSIYKDGALKGNKNMKNIFNFFMLCFIIILFTGCVNYFGQSKLARDDIHFITKTLLENHPGPKNIQDPEFMNILNSAHQEALADSENVSTEAEHVALLKKYTGHFNDHHLAVFIKHEKKSANQRQTKWAGFSIKEWLPGVIWVTLPSFGPQNDEQTKRLQAVISQLPEYRESRCVIFDVRGNGGGSSGWGTEIIESLFGKDYAAKKIYEYYKKVYADWRLSPGNIDHIRQLLDELKKNFEENREDVRWESERYSKMKAALAENRTFYSEKFSPVPQLKTSPSGPEKMCGAKLVVLIDSGCFSACLDFLDQLKGLDSELTFVGKTTNADTIYMDVRRVELPSKLGELQFPMKVLRNRPRGSNEPYQPDIVYEGDFNDTQKVEQWLRSHVVPRVCK